MNTMSMINEIKDIDRTKLFGLAFSFSIGEISLITITEFLDTLEFTFVQMTFAQVPLNIIASTIRANGIIGKAFADRLLIQLGQADDYIITTQGLSDDEHIFLSELEECKESKYTGKVIFQYMTPSTRSVLTRVLQLAK